MRRNLRMAVVISLVLGPSGVALADLESDFKDAVSKEGCESIPYSDLRGNCTSQQTGVTDWCKNSSRPVTCGSESITRDLKKKVEDSKKNVDNLKQKKRDLEDKKSRATDDKEKDRLGKEIEQCERDLYDGNKAVDQAVADVDARKKLVEDALYNIEKCIDYRRAVMNVFASAQDKVRGETDAKIVAFARQLRDKYEESKRGHEIAIKDKENARSTCKDSRP